MITKERYAVLLKLEESANKQNIESITTSDIDKLKQELQALKSGVERIRGADRGKRKGAYPPI